MFKLLLLLTTCQLTLTALPPGWKACKRGTDDYSKCLASAFTTAIKSLRAGNKKLNLQGLDPLTFDRLIIDQSHGGGVAIKLDLKDFVFKGLTDMKVMSIENDWKKLVLVTRCDNPIDIHSKYNISGKVLVLPISGEGICTMSWKNVTTTGTLLFKEISKRGKMFLEVTDFILDIEPKKVIFHFDNLFNGNKALGDNMNLFLNENWEDIIKDLKPTLQKALSQGFLKLSNQIFSKIPLKDLDPQ